jgi:hypothetical protein
VRRSAVGLALSLALLIAACGGSALPPPAAGEAPSPSAGGSAPAVASAPTGSGGGPASGAVPSAPAGFTEGQAQLFGSLRGDAQVDCRPRTNDLPAKATDGVECATDSDLVERLGVYRFATPEDALAAYVARLASYNVSLRSGNCFGGTAGDSAWTPGDGPTEGGNLPWRIGCFIDENGNANIRLTCGSSPTGDPGPGRYIGILGATNAIGPLLEWANAYPEGVDVPVPAQPGVCFNPALPAPH